MLPDRVVYLLSNLVLSVFDLRQLETADGNCQHYQSDAQAYIRRLDRCRFMQAISLQCIGSQCSYVFNSLGSCAQDEQATKKRREEGSQRVERLCQIEAAGRGLGFAQYCDIRIRCHLQAGNTGGKNNE